MSLLSMSIALAELQRLVKACHIIQTELSRLYNKKSKQAKQKYYLTLTSLKAAWRAVKSMSEIQKRHL